MLARNRITLELRPSSGSLENLHRLADEASGVSVGFVQSGIGTASETPGLVSLGSLYYEPWRLTPQRQRATLPSSQSRNTAPTPQAASCGSSRNAS